MKAPLKDYIKEISATLLILVTLFGFIKICLWFFYDFAPTLSYYEFDGAFMMFYFMIMLGCGSLFIFAGTTIEESEAKVYERTYNYLKNLIGSIKLAV